MELYLYILLKDCFDILYSFKLLKLHKINFIANRAMLQELNY